MQVGEATSEALDTDTGERRHRICLRVELEAGGDVTLRLRGGSFDQSRRAAGVGVVEVAFEDVDPEGDYTLTVTPDGDQPTYDAFAEIPYRALGAVASGA